MKDTIRTVIDYAAAEAALQDLLALNGSPVAIKIVRNSDDIPAGVAELDEATRHCQMVNLARKEGRIFYAPPDKHSCQGGGFALGLKEITPSLDSGEFYYALGKFESWPACKRTLKSIPALEPQKTYATMYAPLKTTPFDPTIVMIIDEPRIMLKLAQALLYRLGGRIHSSFSGIQSVCADATAQTYLTGNANFSLGCDGSRKFSGIADNEMVMGMPVEILPELIESLKIVTSAPGSVKK